MTRPISQDDAEKAKISDMVKAFMAECDAREAERVAQDEAETPSTPGAMTFEGSPAGGGSDQDENAGVDV